MTIGVRHPFAAPKRGTPECVWSCGERGYDERLVLRGVRFRKGGWADGEMYASFGGTTILLGATTYAEPDSTNGTFVLGVPGREPADPARTLCVRPGGITIPAGATFALWFVPYTGQITHVTPIF